MWIQVRSMDGRKSVRLDNLSKLTKIEIVREKIAEDFDAEPERQRLFYRGKQLEDGHTLFDYDVGLNDIIQVFIRPRLVPQDKKEEATPITEDTKSVVNVDKKEEATPITEDTKSVVNDGSQDSQPSECDEMEVVKGDDDGTALYKVGDKVDGKDLKMGAWFEAQIKEVLKSGGVSDDGPTPSNNEGRPNYRIVFDDYEDELLELSECHIRPRARYRLQWDQLSPGQTVMVNYNSDRPNQRGFWYDASITRKVESPRRKLYCKLILGQSNEDASEECLLKFHDEVFRIEDPSLSNGDTPQGEGEGEERIKKPDCDHCKDNPSRRCKHCACSVCGGKNDPDKQILCDECDMAFHLWCLTPPLEIVPESDDWYCSECKTDTSQVVGAGDKLKLTKKKASMQSNKGASTSRDWGKGMACVGRTKVCTIVPSNHFGPIPGVPVGAMWKFRVQVSESGVHRPHVAGIHGRENEGAYSIVLSGGYEDDKDSGDEFIYSGSGGRDLSGNRRTAKQSMDQKLTAMNRALAKNCGAGIDDKNGAEAKAWRKGKPVRVVRNHKGSKTSKYCPKEGNRYDGIYKIAKYWPQRNKEGLLVWKYLLRRDDTSPAPWTSEGKKIAKKLGLTMQYPDGYLEAQNGGRKVNEDCEEEEEGKKSKKGKKRKGQENMPPANSKNKQPRYELSEKQRETIKSDSHNTKLWMEILSFADSAGSAGLLGKIEEFFSCIVCQEVVFNPISTPCGHNICKECLSRAFKADVSSCPNCRHQLGEDYKMEVNSCLQKILLDLFPGYSGGR